MLAAMLIPGARFANRIDMQALGTWIATVTGTVYFTAASIGGGHGGHLGAGNYGGGAGGGGGFVGRLPVTVAVGDTVTWIVEFAGTQFLPPYAVLRVNGSAVLQLEKGHDASNFVDGRGTQGAAVSCSLFTLAGGLGAGSLGGNGTDGAAYLSGGVVAYSGGGGGAGNQATPPLTGGMGGAVGPFTAPAAIGIWGSPGAGVIPGQTRLGPASVSSLASSDAYARLEW